MRYNLYSNDDIPLLNIRNVGYAKMREETKYGPGCRNDYIIHYVLQGKGYYNGNPVQAGQGFLIRPDDAEYYFSDASDPWAFLWFISQDHAMEAMFARLNEDPNTHVFQYDSGTAQVVRAVAERVILDNNAIVKSTELLELFLRIFNRQVHAERDSGASNAETYYRFAKQYIADNLHTAVTVETLTAILGVSQAYLYRVFRTYSGRAPKQYIDLCRLAQARKLLADTRLTVQQVAEAVGFADASAFSKFFSHHAGLSPRQYRVQSVKKSSAAQIIPDEYGPTADSQTAF